MKKLEAPGPRPPPRPVPPVRHARRPGPARVRQGLLRRRPRDHVPFASCDMEMYLFDFRARSLSWRKAHLLRPPPRRRRRAACTGQVLSAFLFGEKQVYWCMWNRTACLNCTVCGDRLQAPTPPFRARTNTNHQVGPPPVSYAPLRPAHYPHRAPPRTAPRRR